MVTCSKFLEDPGNTGNVAAKLGCIRGVYSGKNAAHSSGVFIKEASGVPWGFFWLTLNPTQGWCFRCLRG